MITAAFVMAFLALALIISGWFWKRWVEQDVERWHQGVKSAMADMTPGERHEWRMWWLRDAKAAEQWLFSTTRRRMASS